MNRHRPYTALRRAALSVLTSTAVLLSSAGFAALATDPAPGGWMPEKQQALAPVPAVGWSPQMGPDAPSRILDGADTAASYGSVSGTSPATLAGKTGTQQAKRRQTATIRTASLSMVSGPVAANDQGSGDFTALPGAASGEWGVAGQTGSFTWSYPFAARQAPVGPTPSVALAYDSSAVDGLTSSTNNQASVVGDGWSLAGLGSIRQQFSPCMDQGVSGSYDLCGSAGGQQFTISFGGRSGKVIKDAATGTYRLQNDDNTKVEYLTAPGSNGTHDGGYWKLTDTSGTQYYFGRNRLPGWSTGKPTTNSADTVPVGAATATQPCSAGTFAASLCQQAYAWNLDYVVDLQGNSQAVYYTQDTNYYAAQAGTGSTLSYVRASRPDRVDYGMRPGTELTATAPLRLTFAYTARCTGVDCTKGTDVPTTFACGSTGNCTTYSPTFYTDRRLQTVSSATLVAGTYQNADVWTLNHSMPDPGDATKPALWLGSISHQGANTLSGVGGAINDAPVTFAGQTLQNRVWVLDGLAPLNRYRLASIKTVTGAVISVTYQSPECTPESLPTSPESNTKRCFPQWWAPTTPIAQPARMDYFHIYPVASVATSAGPGGTGSTDMTTRYQYVGTPAWKYAGPKYVAGSGGSQITWSVLAGWSQVKTILGNGPAGSNPTTMATYLRGLDGTPSDKTGGTKSSTLTTSNGTAIPDSPWLAGTEIESQTYVGEAGSRLSSTVTVPWASAPTATGSAGTGAAQARHIGTLATKKYTASGQPLGTRTTATTNYFDSQGRITAVSEEPETGSGTSGTCTLTAYADNGSANILVLPATVTTRNGTCGTDGTSSGTVLKASRTLYDTSSSAEPGTSGYLAPNKGNPVRSDTATAVSGPAVTTWLQGPTIGYDGLGRATTSTDTSTGSSRTTTTAYTPAAGLPTSVTTTNPAGWTATSTYDSVRGNVLTEADENANTTTYRYDASGRTTGVWDPMRPAATNPVPTQATTYNIQQTAPSWILTGTINGLNQVINSYTIYDGLGRSRQTQKMSPGGGTIATDTFYNSAGAKRLANNDYYMTAEPSGTLMTPTLAVPSSSQYDYDGAGRMSKVTALANDNQTLWATNIAYAGSDTATTTGPGAESASTVIVNGDGNVISRLLYRGTTPTGTPDTTTYSYDALGQNTSMKDTAGNTWSWSYDPAGRQTSAVDPDTGASTNTYDASGRLTSTSNALNTVTSYTYDSLDRITAQTVTPSGGSTRTLVTRTYDGEKKGQLSSTTRYNGANYDQAVTTAFSGYNAAYLPKTTTVTLPAGLGTFAGSYSTTRYYTKTGQLNYQATPALGGLPAETLYYGYDEFGHQSSLANQNDDTLAGSTQYNHLGQISTFQQFDRNASSTTLATTGKNQTYFTWDATTGRLTNHWTTNIAKGITSDLGKTSYAYTPGGKLSSRSVAFSSRSGAPTDFQCYSYDYASRLAAVWTPSSKNCSTVPSSSATAVAGLGGPAPYAQTYTYTASGDRSQVKRFGSTGALAVTEAYTYKAAGQAGAHQLQSIVSTPATGSATTAAFAWDSAGRMTNRSGETLSYTGDGRLSGTSGKSTLPANPNPSATAGTPPAPAAGVAGSTSNRYYDASGNLVGINDGTGTTVTLGNTTAHSVQGTTTVTGTCTYSFGGKTVAQRTAQGSAVKLAFIVSDGVDTAQTIAQPTTGTTAVTAITRYTDPSGLSRGATQSATGTAAYTTAPAGAIGNGSNAANVSGFGAANGYINGLADTISNLTHLGARDLDPITGAFTSPDPVLHTDNPSGFTPYAYSANDPVNFSDPSGLDFWGDVGNWFHDNAGTITQVVTAIVVTAVVATAATACVASVVCAIGVAVGAGVAGAVAGYAAGNAVDVAVGNKKAPSAQQYWNGMGQAALWGGVGGGIGAGLGAVASKAAPYVGNWIGATFASGSSYARSAAASAAPRLIAAGQAAARASQQATKNLGQRASASASSQGLTGKTVAPYYPPNEGFAGPATAKTLPPGVRMDRFGHPGGKYTSPEGTPFGQRALPPGAADRDYNVYETTRELRVTTGKIAPWFGEVGGGTQYVLPRSVQSLLDDGFLKEVGK